MNHETTIKRIQELTNGMALEFGCEVIWHNPYHDKDELFKIIAIEWHNKKEFTVMMTPITKSAIRNIEDTYKFDERILGKEFEILGKPITLATVLLAIDDESLVIEAKTGQFGTTTAEGVYVGEHAIWNLSKDNFNDQSDETKTFIGELLN